MENPNSPVPINQETDQQLTGTEVLRIQDLLEDDVAENTRRVYRSAWQSFLRWTNARNFTSLPAEPHIIAAYLSYLADEKGLSLATIKLHRSAIAAAHRRAGLEDKSDHEGVRRIMRAISRRYARPQRQAMPLTSENMAVIRATARIPRPYPKGGTESEEDAQKRALTDVALLATLRDGLMRRSEAANLTWEDVEFHSAGHALVTIRKSKTDQEGEGAVLYIGKQATRALLAFRPENPAAGQSVFGIGDRQMANRIKATAEAAGLGEGFTGHSGRVGMAQDLVRNGTELPALMQAGRWKSPAMPARYTERQAAARGAVAKYYEEDG